MTEQGRPADAYPGSSAESEAEARRLAIAIEDDESERPPRVVAKGQGALAEQILRIAFERDVKVRTDADLAAVLAAVELDSEIPLAALAAVAEILSYVYRSQQAMAEPNP